MPNRRGLVSAAIALSLIGSAFVSPARAVDAPAVIKPPHPGCVTFTDPPGDSTPPWGNDPDLDITWAAFASPPGKIRAFVHVDALGDPKVIGHVFEAGFDFNGKPVDLIGGADGSGFSSIPRAAGKPLTSVTYDASPVAGAVVDVVFDKATSTVILTTDRAPIETAAKASLADGVTVSGVVVHSSADAYLSRLSADTAPTTLTAVQSTYTLGDNHCFLPPKGVLSLTAPAATVYGHAFTLSGLLTDETSKVIANKTVMVTAAGATAELTTDASGAISEIVPGTLPAGSYDVTAAFAGDDDLQKAEAAAHVIVSAAPTSMALSAASGRQVVVKAQLLDDMKQPLSNQPIAWTVDGKVVKTTKTDASGKASFTTSPKRTVKAGYAGLTGRYAPSSATKKV